ncbi:MAG: L-fucose mutarotase [Kiritimatiellia bacterium]
MLKGISPVISPELLKIMAEMGHGDELVLADAHFPGHTMCSRVVRADGLGIPVLLEGIIPLFELDSYSPPLIMMAAVQGDQLDPSVEESYVAAMAKNLDPVPAIERIDRFAFYDRVVEDAFAVVVTGETAKYGNIILKKGVTPVS